jgi:hypothetical protein
VDCGLLGLILCSLVEDYQCIRGIYCLHLQGRREDGGVCSSKTLLNSTTLHDVVTEKTTIYIFSAGGGRGELGKSKPLMETGYEPTESECMVSNVKHNIVM